MRYVNDIYRRIGTLWEGRFKVSLVDSQDYFLCCCRYIELNPVRAHIVRAPEEYPWSNYRRYALGMPDSLISPHEEYERLGSTPEERQFAYRELFQTKLSCIELE